MRDMLPPTEAYTPFQAPFLLQAWGGGASAAARSAFPLLLGARQRFIK